MRRPGIVFAVVALAACGDDGEPPRSPTPPARACTEIGCDDRVEVRLRRPPSGRIEVTVCAQDRCQTVQGTGRALQQVGVPLAPAAGDTARVSVTIRKGGRTVARVSERLEVATMRPNGPNCPPVCRFIDARLDVPDRLLQPA